MSSPIRFGTFEFDPRARELRKSGRKIRAQEKPLILLSILLERPGEIISREELQERLWPEDTFVDFTQGLNTAMAKLRSALGDPADNPAFIETVPRRGYRFLAPVTRQEPSVRPSGETRAPPEAVSGRRGVVLVIGGALLVGVLALLTGVLATIVSTLTPPDPQLQNGGHPAPLDSLAVLPLENLMEDPEQDHFVDGMTDLLTANLAQISALKVTSRTSTARYKNTRMSLPEIARQLGVAAVVEGSVMRSGDRVRVTVQLIEAAGDTHLWAESYEREVGDVLALQNEVARAISQEVRVVLTQQEQDRLEAARRVDPEAYEAYLQGRFFLAKRTQAGSRRATEFFEQAIEKDPTFALAHVGLGDAYLVQRKPTESSLERASAAVTRALELDPLSAEAHTSLGLFKAFHEYDWAGTQQSFERAIALSPSYATAHHWYGIFLSLIGRSEEAFLELQKAIELDPFSLAIRADLGAALLMSNEPDRAVEQCLEVLEMDEHFAVGNYWLGRAYLQKQMYPEAIAALSKATELDEADTLSEATLGHAYAASGNLDVARPRLEHFLTRARQGQSVSGEISIIYLGMSKNQEVIDWLEKAYEDHHEIVMTLGRDPWFDPLRAEPRFQDLLRRLRFPPGTIRAPGPRARR